MHLLQFRDSSAKASVMDVALDRPVWATLTTRHAALAWGDARAWRLDAAVGPFAAPADTRPESLAALAALLPAGDEFWLVESAELPLPPGLALRRQAPLDQMVATAVAPPTAAFAIDPLGEADAPDMLALATLTKPGPFRRRTHELGRFVGVRDGDGRLIAMAGERMKLPGYVEVSGVCTHPDHRGRGYAAQLMRAVASRIIAAGDAAFLHVYPSNAGAIALYETLGFRRRRGMSLQIVAR